jgi:hypothetical protein
MLGVLVFLIKFSLVVGTVGLKTDMSRPVIEPAVGASTLAKSYPNSVLSTYEPPTWLPQCMCLHENTWAALRSRPSCSCKLFNPEYWHQALVSPRIHCQARLSSKTDHVGVTTMERPDQGHLHPELEVPRLTCLGRVSILAKSAFWTVCFIAIWKSTYEPLTVKTF